jgi:hypothetical protein
MDKNKEKINQLLEKMGKHSKRNGKFWRKNLKRKKKMKIPGHDTNQLCSSNWNKNTS